MLALEGLLSVFTAMPQLLMVRGGLRCVLCWCNRRNLGTQRDLQRFVDQTLKYEEPQAHVSKWQGRDYSPMWYLFIQLPDNKWHHRTIDS